VVVSRRRSRPWIVLWGPLFSGSIGSLGGVLFFVLARESEPPDVTSTAAVGEAGAAVLGILLTLGAASVGLGLWTRDFAIGWTAGLWAIGGLLVAVGILVVIAEAAT
jgi:hypothetical protein